MTDEKKVEFLWNAAWSLDAANGRTEKLLKSYLLTTSRKVALNDVNLPSDKFGPQAMCRKCSSPWADGDFAMKSIPQGIKSSKARMLLQKFELKVEGLTKKQKMRAKWYKKRICGQIELLCKLCSNKSSYALKKPQKVNATIEKETEPVACKKKKKKKDKTAGLKIKQPNPPKNVQTSAPKKLETQPKPQKLSNQSKAIKNSQKPQQNKKQPPKVVMSKTQQKNSILQLANMLKKSAAAGASSGSGNRLQNLLK